MLPHGQRQQPVAVFCPTHLPQDSSFLLQQHSPRHPAGQLPIWDWIYSHLPGYTGLARDQNSPPVPGRAQGGAHPCPHARVGPKGPSVFPQLSAASGDVEGGISSSGRAANPWENTNLPEGWRPWTLNLLCLKRHLSHFPLGRTGAVPGWPHPYSVCGRSRGWILISF